MGWFNKKKRYWVLAIFCGTNYLLDPNYWEYDTKIEQHNQINNLVKKIKDRELEQLPKEIINWGMCAAIRSGEQ